MSKSTADTMLRQLKKMRANADQAEQVLMRMYGSECEFHMCFLDGALAVEVRNLDELAAFKTAARLHLTKDIMYSSMGRILCRFECEEFPALRVTVAAAPGAFPSTLLGDCRVEWHDSLPVSPPRNCHIVCKA